MRVLLLLLLCAVTMVEVYAQDRSYGRSMVISSTPSSRRSKRSCW